MSQDIKAIFELITDNLVSLAKHVESHDRNIVALIGITKDHTEIIQNLLKSIDKLKQSEYLHGEN